MSYPPYDATESVQRHEFDIIERHYKHVRPDLSMLGIGVESYQDHLRDDYIDHLRTWITGKKTSKTVELNETVRFRFSVPASWFDHLLIEHKWLQWVFFWHDPEQEEISDEKHVHKTSTVEFAALIPEMQIPEHVRRDGRKTFEVYYTVL